MRNGQSLKQKQRGQKEREVGRRGYFVLFLDFFRSRTCFYITLHQAAANELKYLNLFETRDQTGGGGWVNLDPHLWLIMLATPLNSSAHYQPERKRCDTLCNYIDFT